MQPAPPPDRPAKLRAALLAAVLLVHGVAASPLPSSVDTSALNGPIGREELGRWVGILGGLGVQTTREELVTRLVAAGEAGAAVRNAVVKPFAPVMRLTGTGQAWGLFTYPNTLPHTLVIAAERGGQWEELYRALDPEHAFLEPQLTYRRMRGVYDDNASKVRPSYDNFTRWVGRQVFAAYPDATRVKVYMERRHVLPPGQPPDPEVKIRLSKVLTPAEVGP